MRPRLLAPLLALCLAVAPVGAAPARANEADLAKALAGIAALYVIGRAVKARADERSDRDDRPSHDRDFRGRDDRYRDDRHRDWRNDRAHDRGRDWRRDDDRWRHGPGNSRWQFGGRHTAN